MSTRILAAIAEQPPDDIGKYAGWGSADDLHAPPVRQASDIPLDGRDQRRAAVDYRYYGPGSALILLYVPSLIALVMALLWLGVPPPVGFGSAVGLAVAFTIVARRLNARRP